LYFPKFNLSSPSLASGIVNVPWVSGGALSIRKKIFHELGGFDERFFLYFEDVDLCKRCENLNNEVVLNTNLHVFHEGGKSTDSATRARAYALSQDRYFAKHRPFWERCLLSLARFLEKYWLPLVVTALSSLALVSVGSGPGWIATGIFLICLTVLTARKASFGVSVILASLVFGQSIRLPLSNSIGLTVTDVLSFPVLVGLYMNIVLRGSTTIFMKSLAKMWWLPAAILPGLLFAYERLPLADFVTTVAYCLRLAAVLSLFPLVRVANIKYGTIRSLLFSVALILAGLGFIQLILVPSLPVTHESWFSQVLLGYSRGGWDPHQNRLFSSWLDPNFLGGFFVIIIGLVFARLNYFFSDKDKVGFSPILIAIPVYVALVLTKSRASFLSLVVVTLAFFFLAKAKRLVVPVISGIIAMLILFPAFSSRIFVVPTEDPTVALRTHALSQAVGHLQRYPVFGIGYNAYGTEQIVSGNVNDIAINSLAGTDNFLLMFLATTGVWGFVILMTVTSVLVSKLLERRTDEANFGALLSLVALIVHAQFIQSFTYIHLLLPLVLIMGSRQDKGNV